MSTRRLVVKVISASLRYHSTQALPTEQDTASWLLGAIIQTINLPLGQHDSLLQFEDQVVPLDK